MSIASPPRYSRTVALRSAPGAVDKDAGVIRSFSVITRGEALGHGAWIDGALLDQIAALGNQSAAGRKSRFTHPGLSGDGLGKHIGRARDFQASGDRVTADLHLSKAAEKSPSGDLPAYILALADEDPAAFGASIVFERDLDAEESFAAQHMVELSAGKKVFQSPDPLNVNNLPHWRAASLRAVDVVDEPAANPDGFFGDEQELAAAADRVLGYALGLSTDAPAVALAGIHPDRVREFTMRFLASRGLELRPTTQPTAGRAQPLPKEDLIVGQDDQTPDLDAMRAEILKSERARLDALRAEFPDPEDAPFVLECHQEGLSVDQACRRYVPLMRERQRELEERAQRAEARAPLSAEGVPFHAGEREQAGADPAARVDLDALAPEERAAAEWDADPSLHQQFFDKEGYVAYRKAMLQGRVRIAEAKTAEEIKEEVLSEVRRDGLAAKHLTREGV